MRHLVYERLLIYKNSYHERGFIKSVFYHRESFIFTKPNYFGNVNHA